MGQIADFISASKPPKVLVCLILFFSATQLGFHFWPSSSLVYGIRLDYLSPTLYFLDILIFLFLILRRPGQRSSRDTENGRSLLKGLIPLLLTNLLYSQNSIATLFWSFHFILYLSFVLEFRSFSGLPRSISQIGLSAIHKVLTLSLFFQTALAIAQVYLGHSVGDLLYYFGERSLSVGLPNIATASFMGCNVLRAYGTFSHPNILAGWSVITLLILIHLQKGILPKRSISRAWLQSTQIPTVIVAFIIFLTQSRSAGLALFGFVIPLYLIKSFKSRLLYFLSALIIFSIIPLFSPSRADFSLSQRLVLQELSLKITSTFPIFGTGASSSISVYPVVSPNFRLLQPDHNSLTLFLSWFGIFGVLAILQIISYASSTKAREKCLQTLRSLGGLLPLLLLDHYLFTSPQGLFVLLLYFSVALNYSHAQKNL